jgi:hypothetical protein
MAQNLATKSSVSNSAPSFSAHKTRAPSASGGGGARLLGRGCEVRGAEGGGVLHFHVSALTRWEGRARRRRERRLSDQEIQTGISRLRFPD